MYIIFESITYIYNCIRNLYTTLGDLWTLELWIFSKFNGGIKKCAEKEFVEIFDQMFAVEATLLSTN